MLAELDVIVFLKSSDDLARTAERVFGALGSEPQRESAEEWGGDHFRANGLGLSAVLYTHTGEMVDPEFEEYDYALEITSQFWDVEYQADLEGPLSEYYARQLAFDLGVETATEISVEKTEQSEIFDIRSYRRNPQYRLDQSPTTPKVFVIETRQVEDVFEDGEDWENDLAEEEIDKAP